MRAAAGEYGWDLNYGGVAMIVRGGCIIRSRFLGRIKEAFDAHGQVVNLLLVPYFTRAIEVSVEGWRRMLALAVTDGRARAGHVLGPARRRRLSQRATAGQPAPGPARLLRSAPTSASTPPAWKILPHRLDRRRRDRHVGVVQSCRACNLAAEPRVARGSLTHHSACTRPYGLSCTPYTGIALALPGIPTYNLATLVRTPKCPYNLAR